MSNTYEFTVRIGTTDAVDDRDTAGKLMQWAVSSAKNSHDHINYVTVEYSEMSAAERGHLLDLLEEFTEDDITHAIESLDGLRKE
jgi:hypothetical protein